MKMRGVLALLTILCVNITRCMENVETNKDPNQLLKQVSHLVPVPQNIYAVSLDQQYYLKRRDNCFKSPYDVFSFDHNQLLWETPIITTCSDLRHTLMNHRLFYNDSEKTYHLVDLPNRREITQYNLNFTELCGIPIEVSAFSPSLHYVAKTYRAENDTCTRVGIFAVENNNNTLSINDPVIALPRKVYRDDHVSADFAQFSSDEQFIAYNYRFGDQVVIANLKTKMIACTFDINPSHPAQDSDDRGGLHVTYGTGNSFKRFESCAWSPHNLLVLTEETYTCGTRSYTTEIFIVDPVTKTKQKIFYEPAQIDRIHWYDDTYIIYQTETMTKIIDANGKLIAEKMNEGTVKLLSYEDRVSAQDKTQEQCTFELYDFDAFFALLNK